MPADLAGELAEALTGSLFVAIGLASVAAGLAARPRRASIAFWFGVFTAMYGVRLLARSELIRLVTGWPQSALSYTDAFITYSILVPAGLFTETLTGAGTHGLVRRAWQLSIAYAVVATAGDLARNRPGASMWLNAPVVLTCISIYLWHTVKVGGPARGWPVEVRAVAVGGALFTAVAFHETVFQRSPFGAPFSLEPAAMLVLTLALGWFVLSRIGEQASEFSALSRELRLARDIQQSLVPQQMPDVTGLHVTGAYLPMSAVAGDFYDLVVRPDGALVIIVADVSGHGVPAALVASMVKVAFAAEVERESRPGAILGGINRALSGKFDRAYVTACCAAIPPGRHGVAYAAAGHPPAMLRRADGSVEQIQDGGMALTLMAQATYETTDVPFGPGDRLLLFTDGLLEASRPGSDEFFGDAELARVVAALDMRADAGESLLAAHRRWIGDGTPLADDVTLVVVERTS